MRNLPQVVVDPFLRLHLNLGLLCLGHLFLNHEPSILPDPRVARQEDLSHITPSQLLHILPIDVPVKLDVGEPAARTLREDFFLFLAVAVSGGLDDLDGQAVAGLDIGVAAEHTEYALGHFGQHVLVLEGVELCYGLQSELLTSDVHFAAQVEGGLASQNVVDDHIPMGDPVGMSCFSPEDEVAC